MSRGLVGVGVQRTCTPQPAMRLAASQLTIRDPSLPPHQTALQVFKLSSTTKDSPLVLALESMFIESVRG